MLTPFKLITVFLHEASHAIACKLTCGHVRSSSPFFFSSFFIDDIVWPFGLDNGFLHLKENLRLLALNNIPRKISIGYDVMLL